MTSTTRYSRGDIVLVSFPFTDLSSTKKRPALVVSPDAFSAATQDLVLAAITSQVDDTAGLTIAAGDCVDGVLPKLSTVKPTKHFTMHSSLVLTKVCALRPEKLDAVLNDLRQFFADKGVPRG